MIRILPYLFALFIVTMSAQAQTRTVHGNVKDAESGQGLPGVSVVVQGTTKGTSTDVEGNYSIELTATENALSFSFVGFKTQTVEVGERSVIDIVLESDLTTLEDVVVVGYGTMKKSDLTGAVGSLKGSDINKIPAASAVLALQGKVPGVQVTTASGAPGSGAVVRIRGVGTFNNAGPIYVVDGVILDNIDFLSPADIESFDVLKDASATAIYGSRGANGVVMVTTRKGKQGQEYPTITVNADYSIQKLNKKIDLLNGKEFATVVNEINPGSFNNVDAVPNTDWQDLLFRTAPIQNYQVSAAGASPRIQYYISVGYFNQQGIIPKSSYERFTIKLNNTYNLAKSVRFGNNLTFAPTSQQNTNGNAVFVVYRAQPTIEPYKPDGGYSAVPGVGNVLADLEYTNNFDKGIRSVGNFYGEVDFLKNFTFKSSLGFDLEYKKNKSFTPVFFVDPQQENSTSDLTKKYNDYTSWLWENTLSYVNEFGKHSVNAVAGYTMQETSSESFSVAGQNILRDGEDFWYIDPGNIVPTSVDNSVDINKNYAIISYLVRANYVYDNRYLVTATYRVDGSSKFASDNRYGQFPSLALGWNVINENFMSNISLLSNLKVRAGWGKTGNEKVAYDRQFSAVLNGLGGVFGQGEIYNTGSTYGPSGNPDLIWESTEQVNIGLELGFIEDKLTAEFDFYNKETSDILINLPIPGYLGNGDGASITYNAAEVLNRGIEVNVGWSDEILDGFRYHIGANATTIHNEALKVMGTGKEDDYLPNGAGTTRTYVGSAVGAFFGYKVDGVFQNQAELDAYPHFSNAEPGDLRYVDTNNDGVLNGNDRVTIGSPIPKLLYGVNLEGAYKGFSLSVDFIGQQGNDLYNAKETVRPALYNFEQHYFNRWTDEGTSNSEPRATAGGNNFLPSTRFIQDGSYFRLRSISLGYSLPSALTEKIHLKTAQVYVRGTNVFTLSKFTGYSPEVTNEDVINNGIDTGIYPIPAVYSVGFNVTF